MKSKLPSDNGLGDIVNKIGDWVNTTNILEFEKSLINQFVKGLSVREIYNLLVLDKSKVISKKDEWSRVVDTLYRMLCHFRNILVYRNILPNPYMDTDSECVDNLPRLL